MKLFRKTIFWLHLVVGLVVGLGVAFMATTGLLMAYEQPIVDYAETYDGRPPAGTKGDAKSIEFLLEAAMDDMPDATPTAVTAWSDLTRPMAVQFGRERVLYLNNYTSKAVGTEAAGLRSFFKTVEELHRWLAASGDWRNWGKNVTGVVNLGFLALVVSGLWLWVPRKIQWKSFRPVLVPNLRLRGKPRDWNWHNVVGFWMLIPLSVIVLTGTIMSYSWATNLVYRAVGETPPAPRGGPGGGEPRNRQAIGPQRDGNRPGQGGGMRGGMGMGGGQPLNTSGLGDLWANAEDASPGWTRITLQLGGRRGGGGGEGGGGEAGDAAEGGRNTVSFAVFTGNPLAPYNRTTLNYDRQTGQLKSTQKFSDQPLGRRLRMLTVPIHRGEVLGLFGMTVAAATCVSALVLVYTGFALSYRRLVRPVIRRVRERRAEAKVPAEPVMV